MKNNQDSIPKSKSIVFDRGLLIMCIFMAIINAILNNWSAVLAWTFGFSAMWEIMDLNKKQK